MSNILVKSFLIPKRGDCSPLNSFIDTTIGANPALIHSIKATAIDSNTTRLDLWYLDKYPEPYKYISIPKGVLLTTGLASLDLRIVFNDPIATGSILSGLVSVDSNALPTSKYSASQFFLNANLTGYNTTGYHYLSIDKDKVIYADGSAKLLSSYYLDYSVYGQSTAGQLVGNKLPKYQRGLTRAVVLRSKSSNTADQTVSNFLLGNNIDSHDVLHESCCIDSSGVHETYLVYVLKPEPELITSSPASDSLLPLACAPKSVTLGFSVPIDQGQVTSQSGLFTIFNGYNSYSDIPPNLVSTGSDPKFVTLALTGYVSSNRAYSIVVNPGLRSKRGSTKTTPDLWNVYIDNYQTGGGGSSTSVALSGIDQFTFAAHTGDTSVHFTTGSIDHTRIQNIGTNTHPQIDAYMLSTTGYIKYLSGLVTGLTGNVVFTNKSTTQSIQGELASAVAATDPASFIRKNEADFGDLAGVAYTNILVALFTGHTGNYSNPHNTTASQLGAATTGSYSYLSGIVNTHTGDSTIHFTQSQISIPYTQVSNFTLGVTGLAPTIAQFTGHTGNTNVHFTQSQISITSTQVSDFDIAAGTSIVTHISSFSGITVQQLTEGYLGVSLSGWLYTGITGHIGNTGIHFTQAQINIPYTQISNFSTGVTGVAPTIAQFTGHTNDTSIHFTQAGISITASQVSDFTVEARTQVLSRVSADSGVEIDNTTSPTQAKFKLSGWLYTGITGHIGTTSIHFTQAQISIPSTQISDWSEAVQDVVGNAAFLKASTGIGYTYDDTDNTLTLSGILASSTTYGVSKFDPLKFTSVTGFVSIPSYIVSVSGLSDVAVTSLLSGHVLMSTSTTGGWRNMALTGKGNNTVIYDYTNRQIIVSGATGLVPVNNLSDVSSLDTARSNLKVRYIIDDLAPCDFTYRWTTLTANGGGSYNYDPSFVPLLAGRNTQGVVIATNGAATGATGAAILYHVNQSFYLSSGTSYYFNVLLASTGTNLARFGMFNTVPSTASGMPSNAIFCEYDSRSGIVWHLVGCSGNNTVRTVTTATGVTTGFNWYCIEHVGTGYKFYDLSNNNRVMGFITGTTIPSASTSYSRAFTQAIGNGGQFNGIYLDKFMHPIYASALPTGIP